MRTFATIPSIEEFYAYLCSVFSFFLHFDCSKRSVTCFPSPSVVEHPFVDDKKGKRGEDINQIRNKKIKYNKYVSVFLFLESVVGLGRGQRGFERSL